MWHEWFFFFFCCCSLFISTHWAVVYGPDAFRLERHKTMDRTKHWILVAPVEFSFAWRAWRARAFCWFFVIIIVCYYYVWWRCALFRRMQRGGRRGRRSEELWRWRSEESEWKPMSRDHKFLRTCFTGNWTKILSHGIFGRSAFRFGADLWSNFFCFVVVVVWVLREMYEGLDAVKHELTRHKFNGLFLFTEVHKSFPVSLRERKLQIQSILF